MKGNGLENPRIIGLTGSFGSGCSYLSDHILAPTGYGTLSLSKTLRTEFESSGQCQPGCIPRRQLQDYGDALRRKHGADYLAKCVWQQIVDNSDKIPSEKWVVDSIRNPAEVHYLRDRSASFFLFGIYASREKRWERVESIYDGNRRAFDEDDERDTGRQNRGHEQRVEDCFAEADVVFANDDNFAAVGNEPFQRFRGKVENYVERVSAPLSRGQPTQSETLMAAAYTLSQRSSCLKRKVGAVIVDEVDDVISSGFNEVPRHGRPCADEFGICGRDVIWDEIAKLLNGEFPEFIEKNPRLVDRLRQKLRILDNCRSLHAEENAIVSLARHSHSVRLDRCTLYTTTYPCRQCANKIVNLGIKRVVYLEPYPDAEARVVLDSAGVEDQFFEGITFKAYSRIYGEKK